MIHFAKAHAYGNDFLYVLKTDVTGVALDRLTRAMCDRHAGIGADGLIVYEPIDGGASMQLFNADGGVAEVSGNGLRGLGAVLLRNDSRSKAALTIQTGAGAKALMRTGREDSRQTFCTAMGLPTDLRPMSMAVGDDSLQLTLLNIGNPHCVILGPLPDEQRFRRLGAALERDPTFPSGTNVEFAHVETAHRVRILIWERGVGPTRSSGTGSCASLVAAAAYGGAKRRAEVVAPGGAQQVEWRDDSVYLTGWAEVLCEGEWFGQIPRTS